MMDLSSVLDAALAVMGAITVLSMGLWTLSSESSTVSTSQEPSRAGAECLMRSRCPKRRDHRHAAVPWRRSLPRGRHCPRGETPGERRSPYALDQ